MPIARLVIIGGFLGSGKTTTVLRLARHFSALGRRVGVVANDQGEQLIDEAIFRAAGVPTRAVTGGCFCCRLDDFIDRTDDLLDSYRPDILLAEPAGSCTDLVATVFKPLARRRADRLELAPYAVLVDPHRALAALSRQGVARLSEKIAYLYRMQQMEADGIVINKVDMLGNDERRVLSRLLKAEFTVPILQASGRTGENMAELARFVDRAESSSARTTPSIDYDVYAAAEAALTWYDATYHVVTDGSVNPTVVLLDLADDIRKALDATPARIMHVKVMIRSREIAAAVAVTSNDGTPQETYPCDVPVDEFDLIINARVAEASTELPRDIPRVVNVWARRLHATCVAQGHAHFTPPRPVPTERIGP